MTATIDPTVFSAESVSAETRAINAEVLERMNGYDRWALSPAETRRQRAEGAGPFPPSPKSPRAEWREIAGPAGPLRLRVFAPQEVRGVYLHIHGGGWMLGAADEQDALLDRIADNCSLAVVSVDYRLAPEEPYPAGPDDCERAALWLVENAKTEFGSDRLTIGGESAGAHLSVATLLRLRDRHGIMPFRAANLTAGCYDLALTPSVRRWGDDNLVLNTHDITNFVKHFLSGGGSVTDPDVSPLHADLAGLPPALFTVGTRDPLLDDSLFMAARWASAGNRTQLGVYPGGAHVFVSFPGALAEEAKTRIDAFLNASLD